MEEGEGEGEERRTRTYTCGFLFQFLLAQEKKGARDNGPSDARERERRKKGDATFPNGTRHPLLPFPPATQSCIRESEGERIGKEVKTP